jgi:type IV secretory pathway VirB2 component (pilin)
VLAICIVVAGFEWAFGWPDWLTVNRLRQKP